MIKSIKLKNWKSFDKLEFKPENINIIIGANASGKSNFLDALELIQKKSNNAGEIEIEKIRGGKNYFNQLKHCIVPQLHTATTPNGLLIVIKC